jgi:hypothetical protein
MMASGIDQTQDRLALRSQLSQMSQLPAWIERLAAHHGIPADIQFAIDLCLEEALSNVIRHGYGGQGIRFLRHFADSLEYEPTPAGNRLSIGFARKA